MTTETNDNLGANPDGGETPWFGDDHKGFVELKGWQSPNDVIQSYQGLEKLLGADKAGRGLVLPKDEADTDGWNQVYQKLGRPEKPDGYEITAPEGGSADFAQAAAGWFHEAGLTKRQAQALAGKWNEFAVGQAQASEQAVQQSRQAALTTLKSEWGEKFDANSQLVDQAFERLGVSPEVAEKLGDAIGRADVLKLFHKVGEMLAPDRIDGGKPIGQLYTPAAAAEKLGQLMNDRGWLDRFAGGDAAARAEKDALDKAILAGKEAA